MEDWDLLAEDVKVEENQSSAMKRRGITREDPKQEMMMKIMSLLAKLGLKSALDVRELQAASLLTVMCEASSVYITCGRERNTLYVKRCEESKKNPVISRPKGPLHTHVWSAFLKVAIGDDKTKPEVKTRLEAHRAAHNDPDKLAEKIYVCLIKKAYDKQKAKVLFAAAGDSQQLIEDMCECLCANGARVLRGIAPKGALERDLEQALVTLEEHLS